VAPTGEHAQPPFGAPTGHEGADPLITQIG
jgi:hypothetical protein